MRLVLLVGFLLASILCGVSRADDAALDPPPAFQPQEEVRAGGMLDESFIYHRNSMMSAANKVPSPQPSPAGRWGVGEPAGGWYGYGFPVKTFRWGWFGARHYYPTVWWHDGYYGDCCRHAYRRGY